MKKVVLLGDSIRQIGYGTVIKDYLPSDVEVWQPEDNCRFSSYLLRMLFDYRDQIQGADVIHFNAGLWDVTDIFDDGMHFTDIEVYVNNMSRVADLLLKMGKKVIFATTTPVWEDYPYDDNEVIKEYNARITKVMKEKGIIINDLNALVSKDVQKYITEVDKIHLSDFGKAEAAKQVANVIKENL